MTGVIVAMGDGYRKNEGKEEWSGQSSVGSHLATVGSFW